MKQANKETIIYGGAFNPPTLAHQAIVQACVDYARPRGADVWLLPSASRYDKEITSPREYRLELLRVLLGDINRKGVDMQIATMELDRSTLTETRETVQEMNETHPDRQFVWVFGTDSIAAMPCWRGGEWLLRNLPMLVVEREGSSCPKLGENAQHLGLTTGSISSTEVRRRLATSENYDELVSASVGNLLKQKYHV